MKLTELVSAKANIKKPVRYDPESQEIFDAVDELILDDNGYVPLPNYRRNKASVDTLK